jgi:hypothetical protein
LSTQIADITALTTQLATDNLASWSDEKRQSFTDTFDARIRVARYLLIKTAEAIATKAKGKHFISEKHLRNVLDTENLKYSRHYTASEFIDAGQNQYSQNDSTLIGGRTVGELKGIAGERADEIISKLPGLNEAVRIISPEVAKLIEKRASLLTKGNELMEEAEKYSGQLDMDDLDQEMTISAFRELVKTREKKRVEIVRKLDDIGDEGLVLDSKINKFLYDGLPGLSDAVIKVITDYLERATAFSALNRRVAEQVKFGDSEAAMEMLKSFEKDEVKVSAEIQEQFDTALDTLRLAAKKGLGSARLKKLSKGK